MSRRSRKKVNIIEASISAIIIVCIAIYGYVSKNEVNDSANQIATNQNAKVGTDTSASEETNVASTSNGEAFNLSTIPAYSENPYVELNNNMPYFTQEDYTTEPFERYSEWDVLGRSGVAFANVCKQTMPKEEEERGEIGNIKNLSGWKQKRYDNLIKDKYLYNRCHLIGWQLAGENANKNNLITGTRYLNVEGMLPFEDSVAEYINQNEANHVLYRVTPVFDGNNLLASGVEMEAWSVEDSGAGVHFNVYCYNVQPGITIDYATGESSERE